MLIALAVLGFIVGLAAVPMATPPLASHPRPAASYAAAVARYDTLLQAEHDLVMPEGASLIFTHGEKTPRAIVLVHGLTNSPRQFKELGQLFYDRGYNVIIPRLPYHGLKAGDVGALKSLTAEKYRDYADNAVDIALGLGDSVFVMGLSGGGVAAAWLAEERPDVTRIVIIAPALTLARIPRPLDQPAMNFICRLPNITIHQQTDSTRRHAYFGVSTRALGQTLKFGNSVLEASARQGRVVHQVTLVTNENDHTIDRGMAERMMEQWATRDSTGLARYVFAERLGMPHDIIDVSQHCGMPDVVYPVLISLMEERTPDPIPAETPRCFVHQPTH